MTTNMVWFYDTGTQIFQYIKWYDVKLMKDQEPLSKSIYHLKGEINRQERNRPSATSFGKVEMTLCN